MSEIKVGSRWRTHLGSIGTVRADEGKFVQMVFAADDPNHGDGGYFRWHFDGSNQPWTLVEDAPDSRDARIAELERDLKIVRECNLRQQVTIAGITREARRREMLADEEVALLRAAVDLGNEQIEALKRVRDEACATVEILKRERDNHDRRAAEWQAKVGELQPQVESLTRDLKIAREWNVKHLATIAQRPDAWTWGKCQEERDEARQALVGAQLMRDAMRKERDDLRAALVETDAKWGEAEARAEECESVATLERARASKARELEAQVETLKRILAAQVKERQEAQDAFVAAERARKQAEAALAADCYGCANTPAISAELQSLRAQVEASKQERRGKVERQSEEIARLNAEVQYQKSVVAAREADVAFVRKNASAEWRTRAEKAEGERDSLRGEVQRLVTALTKSEALAESLKCSSYNALRADRDALRERLVTSESERDAARAHRREVESQLSESPPRRMQRKVEAQRVALAVLEEKNKILTEKVAAQWARAERAGYERGQFLAEVQRLTPKVATLETVTRERDKAHKCLREIKDYIPRDIDRCQDSVLWKTLRDIRERLGWIS